METRALEVVVALAGIFISYSLLVSQVGEMISGLLSSRASHLAQGVIKMLGPNLGLQVLNHPLVKSLGFTRIGVPSYLPKSIFARAVMDVVSSGGAPASAALAGLDLQGANVEDAEARIGDWFDHGMDRVSGAYRRYAQRIALLIAFVLVAATNADALHMTQTLWTQPTVKQAGALLAQKQLDACKPAEQGHVACPDFGSMTVPSTMQVWSMKEVKEMDRSDWLLKLLGLLLTTFGVALGAPFWFDVLGRIAPGIRLAGPEPKPETPAPGGGK